MFDEQAAATVVTYPVTLRLDPLGGRYLVQWATPEGAEITAPASMPTRTASAAILAGSRAIRRAVSSTQDRAAQIAADRANARLATRKLFGPQ